MNLDLTHQFLLGSAPLQRRFVNDLSCCDCLCLALDKLIAFGEATFAEEAASLVGDNLAWLIVVFRGKRLYFLLNDLQK